MRAKTSLLKQERKNLSANNIQHLFESDLYDYLGREFHSHIHMVKFCFQTRYKSCLCVEGCARLLAGRCIIAIILGVTSLGI